MTQSNKKKFSIDIILAQKFSVDGSSLQTFGEVEGK
jgi:hypothetical protein